MAACTANITRTEIVLKKIKIVENDVIKAMRMAATTAPAPTPAPATAAAAPATAAAAAGRW